MKKKICVLFGGESTEYEISLKSAYSVLNNLDKNLYDIITVGIRKDGKWFIYDGEWDKIPQDTWYSPDLCEASILHGSKESCLVKLNPDNSFEKIYFDVAFPVLHGKNGEDGTVQGLFELASIKYVGVGIIASSVGMDKTFSKIIFENAGIPQAKWYVMCDDDKNCPDSKIDEIEAALTYPMFVKPANAGSSIGIGKAKCKSELISAVKEAFKFDRKVLVEEFLTGHEVECAVLGDRSEITASCVGEIVASGNEFYTYDAKYSSDSTSELYIPAKISEKHSEKVRKYAIDAFRALDGIGLSRVDFFVDENADKVCINEINTLPGFTSISMYPKLFEASGISYSELLNRLIEIAIKS